MSRCNKSAKSIAAYNCIEDRRRLWVGIRRTQTDDKDLHLWLNRRRRQSVGFYVASRRIDMGCQVPGGAEKPHRSNQPTNQQINDSHQGVFFRCCQLHRPDQEEKKIELLGWRNVLFIVTFLHRLAQEIKSCLRALLLWACGCGRRVEWKDKWQEEEESCRPVSKGLCFDELT